PKRRTEDPSPQSVDPRSKAKVQVQKIAPVERSRKQRRTLTQIIREREEALKKKRGGPPPKTTPDGRPIYQPIKKQPLEERERLRKILEGKE
ncbi:MAG: hypothetical protein HQL53_08205, partial [Magnetococcales bacterium]|nr:hypothetical protein [Magnetococcales bacterium]